MLSSFVASSTAWGADYRSAEGANERVQLEALLASVALESDG